MLGTGEGGEVITVKVKVRSSSKPLSRAEIYVEVKRNAETS